jgi:hypothetical protein
MNHNKKRDDNWKSMTICSNSRSKSFNKKTNLIVLQRKLHWRRKPFQRITISITSPLHLDSFWMSEWSLEDWYCIDSNGTIELETQEMNIVNKHKQTYHQIKQRQWYECTSPNFQPTNAHPLTFNLPTRNKRIILAISKIVASTPKAKQIISI